MEERFAMSVDSPIGALRLFATREALVEVRLPGPGPPPAAGEAASRTNPLLERVAEELALYFRGARTTFSVPTAAAGTGFQREVWAALATIPYGERRSYAWLAEAVGRPRAFRAVGGANGRNPLPIVVPCHRVVAADGTLGGYSGGIGIKRWLLDHERRVAESGGKRAR